MPGLDGMLKASQAGRSDSWGGGGGYPSAENASGGHSNTLLDTALGKWAQETWRSRNGL